VKQSVTISHALSIHQTKRQFQAVTRKPGFSNRVTTIELKWLEDFLSLCDTRNFRISSQRRCVSQPAFSRRIKTLEKWLGAELIDRTVQPVKLTNAGEVFKPVALEIVLLAYQSRDNIYTQISADVGKIRFSTVSTLAQFFVPGWLKQLRPFVESKSLSVRTDFRGVSDYLAALEDGRVDFFICYEDPSKTIVYFTEKFNSILLGTESLVPVVSPDDDGNPTYWLPSCKPGSTIPFLHTHSKPYLWPVRQLLENRFGNLKFVTVYESSIATAIRAMVVEGYGVAWIPRSIVADDLETGRLVLAAEEGEEIPLDIKIYRYEPNAEPGTEKFWQALLHNNSG
jgi:DNA-binding transcriptional LysR family regulator